MTGRLAWAGLLCGALPALVAWAPAAWLAQTLNQASEGRVMLADAAGTVWRGSAVMALTGGLHARDAMALPGRLHWRLGFNQGLPAVWLQQACCVQGRLLVQWQPGWNQQVIRVQAQADGAVAPSHAEPARAAETWGDWPASVLAGLGAPWNTLRPNGSVQVSSQQLEWQLTAGRLTLRGQLELQLSGLVSRISTLGNLGDYRLTVMAPPTGGGAIVQLHTLRGPLLLQGQGQWSPRGLRFRGQAAAQPGSEAALDNLLSIIGQRQGAVAVLSIG